MLYKDVASGKLVFPLDKVINQISLSKILQSFVDQINIDSVSYTHLTLPTKA